MQYIPGYFFHYILTLKPKSSVGDIQTFHKTLSLFVKAERLMENFKTEDGKKKKEKLRNNYRYYWPLEFLHTCASPHSDLIWLHWHLFADVWYPSLAHLTFTYCICSFLTSLRRYSVNIEINLSVQYHFPFPMPLFLSTPSVSTGPFSHHHSLPLLIPYLGADLANFLQHW